eukprot:TRINITY_DN3480_c0_g1_i1.p1 TRINITY_DN3480_c0_g1~~TRINITY_DN3480_c0_g1_i1.p1  ORF type:complete len:486 (-),score=92.52 TRINITY_DN3480_c0_g1_i1:51-1508(-)
MEEVTVVVPVGEKPTKHIDEEPIDNAPSYLTKHKKDAQDFSELVAKRLPEIRDIAIKENRLPAAIDEFLALEKQTRQGADIASTKKVAIALVQVCFELKNWAALNESLTCIAKRRGQMKQVVSVTVQEGITYLDQITDVDTQIELINTLRSITEGKIFVEIERARLTKKLADIRESQGKISEAADILQEAQVETYGAMDPREKITFILEQIRLCLAKNDLIRAQIISRKVTNKALNASPDFEDLKILYYERMVQFYKASNEYLDICKSYRQIYDTKLVQSAKDKWTTFLKYIVVFGVLAPYGNEQADMLHRISQEKKLIELGKWRAILKKFTTEELIVWPAMKESWADAVSDPDFASDWKGTTKESEKLWKDLNSRVVEHNIRVIAKYYQLIKMDRFAQLCDLNEKDTEKYVSDMVSSGLVWAKIDRPKGIVSFRKRQDPSDILNDWSHDVSDLLNLLDKTCHLINRETVVNEKKFVESRKSKQT